MMTESRSWLNLTCNYFESICNRVLVHRLAIDGFTRCDSEGIIAVRYCTGSLFVEFSYYVEDSPTYSLSVFIGLGSGMFDHRGSYAAVPLWYVSDVVGLTSGPWRFSSPDQLAKIFEEIYDSHLHGILQNVQKSNTYLEDLIASFNQKAIE